VLALANISTWLTIVAEATLWRIIRLVVVIGFGLLIQSRKKRELQESMSKSYFGTEEKGNRHSEADEHKQFALLTS
jgi:hypothetical protein